MDHCDRTIHDFIAARLAAGAPFVFFREPGEKDFRVYFCDLARSKSRRSVDDILSDGKNPEGFLFAPFSAACHPVIFLAAENRAASKAALLALLKANAALTDTAANQASEATVKTESAAAAYDVHQARDAYFAAFSRMEKALLSGDCRKIVLSRQKTMALPPDFSPFAVFERAASRYPDAMVSMFFHPDTGLWIGSTPELLLMTRGNEAATVALAGTMPLAPEAPLPALSVWSGKNREEQAYVSDYLRETIARHGRLLSEEGPRTVRAAALCHLKTDFRFSVEENRPAFARLLADLHPTPAVCGLPKTASLATLLLEEGVDRRWYAGYLGPVSLRGDALPETRLYVNLRTFSVDGDRLTFYAGGGLVAQSEAESEWQETEHKMQTMMRTL